MTRNPFRPPYTIRRSDRAKNVLFRIRPHSGLEVVAPRGFDPAWLPAMLERRREWIENAFQRLGVDPSRLGGLPELPETLEYRAIGQTLPVRCVDSRTSSRGRARAARAVENAGTLLLSGPLSPTPEDREACFKALREHVRATARRHLPPRLERIARSLGLAYSGAVVRLQRSRWGSCSAKHLISLNAKLVFLPPELADHVLIHELCHTVHLNHSKRFKDLELKLNPDRDRLDRALGRGFEWVPPWVTG